MALINMTYFEVIQVFHFRGSFGARQNFEKQIEIDHRRTELLKVGAIDRNRKVRILRLVAFDVRQ